MDQVLSRLSLGVPRGAGVWEIGPCHAPSALDPFSLCLTLPYPVSPFQNTERVLAGIPRVPRTNPKDSSLPFEIKVAGEDQVVIGRDATGAVQVASGVEAGVAGGEVKAVGEDQIVIRGHDVGAVAVAI